MGDIGALVVSHSGEVVATADKRRRLNVAQFDHPPVTMIGLPNLSSMIRTTCFINNIYGVRYKAVAELVHFVHCIGHWTFKDMLFLSTPTGSPPTLPVDNFPLTREQVKKHFRHDGCHICQKANMQRRSFANLASLDDTRRDRSSVTPVAIITECIPVVSQSERPIGYELGHDLVSAFGKKLSNWIDKTTGYGNSHVLLAKKDMAKVFHGQFVLYSRYGHHTVSPVRPSQSLHKTANAIF